MPNKRMDATHLFEAHPTKSEQWWTSLFSLLLVKVGKSEIPQLPLQMFAAEQNGWRFETQGFLDASSARLANIHIEANLIELFNDLEIEFAVKPDVVIRDADRKYVRIIENKTRRASVGALSLYARVAERLQEQGYDSGTILLISAGHPDDYIWKKAAHLKIPILLWETVLHLLNGIASFRELFDDPLQPFYENPVLNDSWIKGGWERYQRLPV